MITDEFTYLVQTDYTDADGQWQTTESLWSTLDAAKGVANYEKYKYDNARVRIYHLVETVN